MSRCFSEWLQTSGRIHKQTDWISNVGFCHDDVWLTMWMKRIWWESWGSPIVRSDILSRINPVAMAASIPGIPNFCFLALQPSPRTHKKDHHHPPNLMSDPRVFPMLTCGRSSGCPPVIVSAWGRACCLVLWVSVLQCMLMTGVNVMVTMSYPLSNKSCLQYMVHIFSQLGNCKELKDKVKIL